MDIHKVYPIFMHYFRKKRLNQFKLLFPEKVCTTIVDLGGATYQWDRLKYNSKINILNLVAARDVEDCPPNYNFVVGDALDTKYEDKSFELAFSNSLIEHVGGWEEQKRFAREIQRIGKRIYCQTPNKYFFVEPHLIAPFIHFLPRSLQSYFLVRYATLWGLIAKPGRDEVEELLSSIRLLNKKEMVELFPDCEILTERFLFMPKSYIAIKQ